MVPIIIIAFREFLEAFLIIGVFLGVARKLKIHKEKELKLASVVALILSFGVALLVYSLEPKLHFLGNFTQAVLSLASAIFIPFTVFSFHAVTGKFTHDKVKQLQAQSGADWSIFVPILLFLLVLKEGLEAIFFNLSNNLFNNLAVNFVGLATGFILAGICGVIVKKLYTKLPINLLYKITEVFVILIGINALQSGLGIIANNSHFSIEPYLLLIDLIYILLIYVIFIREKTISVN